MGPSVHPLLSHCTSLSCPGQGLVGNPGNNPCPGMSEGTSKHIGSLGGKGFKKKSYDCPQVKMAPLEGNSEQGPRDKPTTGLAKEAKLPLYFRSP